MTVVIARPGDPILSPDGRVIAEWNGRKPFHRPEEEFFLYRAFGLAGHPVHAPGEPARLVIRPVLRIGDVQVFMVFGDLDEFLRVRFTGETAALFMDSMFRPPSTQWVLGAEETESPRPVTAGGDETMKTFGDRFKRHTGEGEGRRDMTVFGFGDAIARLREGQRVARSGWNGKGMHLFLVENWACITETKDEDYPHLPFITMKTADDHVVPWLASQTDMLAGDWVVVP